MVEVRFDAVELGHVVTAGLVAEFQPPRHRRHSVRLVQIHRLDGLGIWPPFVSAYVKAVIAKGARLHHHMQDVLSLRPLPKMHNGRTSAPALSSGAI